MKVQPLGNTGIAFSNRNGLRMEAWRARCA
jgi:hypothetical protein